MSETNTLKDRYETAVECGVDLTYPQWLENELLAAQRRPVDVANIIHIASHYGYVTIDAKKVLSEALPNEQIITRAHDLVGQSPISAASAALTAILENLLEQRGQTLIQVENNGNVSPVGETPESDMTRMVETETPLPGFEPPPDPEPEPSPTPKKAQAVPAQIIWMERDETSSSGSPMWRCDVRFQGGDTDRVNVFLHRIPDRNTFRFFQGAGYGDILQAMKKGDILTWENHPIRVQIEPDGKWWSLTGVEKRPDDAEPDPSDVVLPSGWAKGLLMKDTWYVIDLETTGTEADARIVQIGVVDQNGKSVLNTLVNPGVPIPAEATAIHGITDKQVAEARTFDEVRESLENLFVEGVPVVAYNTEFERMILVNEYKRLDIQPADGPAWTWNFQCAMKAYAAWKPNPANRKYGSWKLAEAAENEGIDVDDLSLHNAAGDARLTWKLIKAMGNQDLFDDVPF